MQLTNATYPTSQSFRECGTPTPLLIPFVVALVCFAFPPTARAVDPPPDGGYPNFNTAEGENALLNLTVGDNNTAIGFEALYSNTTGGRNTAIGSTALVNNTTGSFNTAIGFEALCRNTTGYYNTANGLSALFSNTGGNNNTASGFNALGDNVTGNENTASGVEALGTNTTGSFNTATGVDALFGNQTGKENTATGYGALYVNSGNKNTATGFHALYVNTTGSQNTATGLGSLLFNATGDNNTANGYQALANNTTGANNTACGMSALYSNKTGSNNIAIGTSAGKNVTTGSNNIDIGALGAAGESNTIRLGKVGVQTAAYVIGIRGATVAGGVSVMVDSTGHLGTITSSARYKEAIKPMEKASEAILALKPVTFRYKHELDPDGTPQFGLVAEQVEKVNSDLVARDEHGKAYTVRYEAVNAMLLNEFLKEHRRVETLEATVDELKSALKEQAAQIRRVSDRIEEGKPAARVASDNE